MPRRSAASFSIISGPEPASRRLEPPPDLSDQERAVFLEAVLSCKADHFTSADGYLLSAYARAVCLERQASAELAATGHIIDGKVNPWLHVLAQSTKSLAVLARMLRLSPVSRSLANPKRLDSPSFYEKAEAHHRETD